MNGVLLSSQDMKDGIVKIQSFIRGCLCRARVSKMVQDLIDDMLLKRGKGAIATSEDKGSGLGMGKGQEANNVDNETKMLGENTEDDTSIRLSALDDGQPKENNKKIDAYKEKENTRNSSNKSAISIDLMEIMPDDIKGRFMETSKSYEIQETNDSMQASVSDILSKFEANRDSRPLSSPAQTWSPLKIRDKSLNHLTLMSPSTKKSGLLVDPKRFSVIPSSINLMETSKSDEIQETNNSMQGSVSDIMSKFEANRDSRALPPARTWPPLKLPEKPLNHQSLVPPSTEKSGLLEDPKRSSLKNTQLRNNATKHVSTSEKVLQEQVIRMNEEIQQLLKDITRVGESGKPYVNFGELFDDDEVANYYEALVGTLKAAKKKGLIKYEGQFLLKGVSDKVAITIL